MMAVAVGIIVQVHEDGPGSPSAIFFFTMVSVCDK